MRRTTLWVSVLAVLTLSVAIAAPQDKSVRGKVTAVSGTSLTVNVDGKAMMFTVNPSTEVIARGAGTKARETQQMTGKNPVITDLVKVGDGVEVTYSESGGTMVAKTVRGDVMVPTTGKSEPESMRLQGVVSAISGRNLTLKPESGEPVTFMVDQNAMFTGAGLGTMAKEKAAEGAKLTLADAVAMGDTIEVTYKTMGDMKHVSGVRVLKKGK